MSVASPSRAAFPVSQAGRHPRLHFRGLLRLHSNYGPLDRSTAQGGLCHRASIHPVTRTNRLPATRSNRQLSGWFLPPLVIRAFWAHCDQHGCRRCCCAIALPRSDCLIVSPPASSITGRRNLWCTSFPLWSASGSVGLRSATRISTTTTSCVTIRSLALLSDRLEAKRKDCAVLSGKSTLNRLEHAPSGAPDRYRRIGHEAMERLFVDLYLDAHAAAPARIMLVRALSAHSDVPCPVPRRTRTGAHVGCFPLPRGLPLISGGSASATSLSRPAQASLELRPVGSLNRPRRPLSQGFDPSGYPDQPPASYQIKPTTVWVVPSSTSDTRLLGARGVEERRGGLGPVGITPFPLPAHQTGRADFPHPASRPASPQSTRRWAKMDPTLSDHTELPEHDRIGETWCHATTPYGA